MLLAVKDGERLTATQMAAMLNVSENHLVKVCIRLSSIGYVKTSRGRGGGVELAILAKEIRVGDAILKLEDSFDLVECMSSETGCCVLTPVCELKGLLEDAKDAFFQTLSSKTIADLTVERRRFNTLVDIPKTRQ
jgi:Rrf2 family nitric oxide-sensitive transcriptional repressor